MVHLQPLCGKNVTDGSWFYFFNRSYELTRKDKLYKNIQRMQHSKVSDPCTELIIIIYLRVEAILQKYEG